MMMMMMLMLMLMMLLLMMMMMMMMKADSDMMVRGLGQRYLEDHWHSVSRLMMGMTGPIMICLVNKCAY